MMKAAIISDIHGNSPALEAVLADIDKGKSEQLYVLGDTAVGVDPKRCLALLNERSNCRCIKGNLEHYICVQDYSRYTRTKDHRFERKVQLGSQVRAEVGPELFGFVCGWPDYLHEGNAYFLHDSPWDRRMAESEGVDLPPDLRDFAYHGRGAHPGMESKDSQEAEDFIRDYQVRTLFCGHTHFPFIHRLKSGSMVNCGSVGQPLDKDPRASWIAWESEEHFVIHRVEYDIEKTVRLLVAGSGDSVADKAWTDLFRRALLVGDHPNEL
jgi:predicted phosphodiesterase